MRLFISEYLTSGACRVLDLKSSLLAEGDAMLAACVHSLQHHLEIECCTTRDSQLPALDHLRVESRVVSSPEEEKIAFEALARSADRVLVIAPETERILEQRIDFTRQIVAPEKVWNCDTESVRICADKLATAALCEEHGIPTIPTAKFSPENLNADVRLPSVVKPRFGAGCEQTYCIRTHEGLHRWQQSAIQSHKVEWINQPWKEGIALSNAFLTDNGRVFGLPLGEQHIAGEVHLHYSGGTIPWQHTDAAKINRIAAERVQKLCEALPGLNGYVGIDWIWDSENHELCLVEINPRMTTSVVGYEALAPGFLGRWFSGTNESFDYDSANYPSIKFTSEGTIQ